MKTIQKLEILAGMLTFASAIAYIYFIAVPTYKGLEKMYYKPGTFHWVRIFLSFILPVLLIAISSYALAVRKSKVGLGVIIIFGSILTILTAISFLIGSVFEGHILIGISPGVFASMTIVLALINTLWFSINNEEFS